jgi:hypothetical protein
MLLLLLINCFHLFVNCIHNVSPQEILAFNHLQGMQLKQIGMNFSMFLYHTQTYCICCTMCY